MILNPLDNELQTLTDFLKIKTPESWLLFAAKNIPLLLLDHAHCERKAAATAIHLISKYPEKKELVEIMSPLAREELLHFEKVIQLMKKRHISFGPLQPSDYASRLHRQVVSRNGNERAKDQLIIGAIIEARSCERFHALIPYLQDSELEKFYNSLIKSEARHFENYLKLARLYGGHINDRVDFFLSIENHFILEEDEVFRFHSGIPGAILSHSRSGLEA